MDTEWSFLCRQAQPNSHMSGVSLATESYIEPSGGQQSIVSWVPDIGQGQKRLGDSSNKFQVIAYLGFVYTYRGSDMQLSAKHATSLGRETFVQTKLS